MDPAEGQPETTPSTAAAPPRRQAIALVSRLLRLSFVEWKALIGVIVLGAVVAGSRFLRVWLVQPFLDEIIVPSTTSEIDFETLSPILSEIGLIAGLTLLITPLAVLGRGYLANWIAARVRQDVDIAVARKFLHAPLRIYREGSTGDLLSRSMADAQMACQSVTWIYKDVILNLQILLGGLVFMAITNWQLTLVTLIAVPPFSVLLSYLMGNILNQANRRQQSQGGIAARLISILSGIKVIKAFQGEASEQAAFDLETGKYFRHHMKIMKAGALIKAAGEAMYPVVGSLVLGLGAVLVANGLWGLTLGKLTAFAVALVTIYKPIKTLAQMFPQVLESAGSARRLFEILDMEEEVADRPEARAMTGVREGIRFRDVHFAYGDTPVLEGIELDVPAGEVVAFVGRTGAGKSTLVDLVLRFHDPTQGAIEIDGTDLRDFRRTSFLDHVAVVTQEPFLFDETIAENIRYGRPGATDEEVRNAARAAAADDFIEALPDGYETLAGEFGLRLSGGQRQRITIARAILANPAILVFDEATSALDAQTERAVQSAIEGLRGQRTIFLVAHRLSTIERADRIVVLDQGRIAEIGDHTSLLANGPLYRELVGAQQAAAS